MIPFNKPHLTGKELQYIQKAVETGKISGNGKFTQLCHQFFEKQYHIQKALLTTSCTDALEMSALLLNIEVGDEIIMPSYTFVSTANAFILRGATIRFIDSKKEHPGLDENQIENLINERTKAIVVVHYAGVACNMKKIMEIADRHQVFVVEDAAQAIDNYYINEDNEKLALGSIGHLATFSFHETKNIIAGEGGLLAINYPKFVERAEIIWEKGTNRSAFFRKEVSKYNWIDIGSSFLPSEITAAFLFAQIEHLEQIQKRRLECWNYYYKNLLNWAQTLNIQLPFIPNYSTNNAHIFYLVCENQTQRDALIQHMKEKNILTVFHYLSLHKSPFFEKKHDGRPLPNSDVYSNCLVRLPLFVNLTQEQIKYIVENLHDFKN